MRALQGASSQRRRRRRRLAIKICQSVSKIFHRDGVWQPVVTLEGWSGWSSQVKAYLAARCTGRGQWRCHKVSERVVRASGGKKGPRGGPHTPHPRCILLKGGLGWLNPMQSAPKVDTLHFERKRERSAVGLRTGAIRAASRLDQPIAAAGRSIDQPTARPIFRCATSQLITPRKIH